MSNNNLSKGMIKLFAALEAAQDPADEHIDDVQELTEADLEFIRKLQARTGIVTVREESGDREVIVSLSEREHGVCFASGLPNGFIMLWSEDTPVEWDEEVDSPPKPETTLQYIARPIACDTSPSGFVHVVEGLHLPLDIDTFFSPTARHRWFACKYDPERQPLDRKALKPA